LSFVAQRAKKEAEEPVKTAREATQINKPRSTTGAFSLTTEKPEKWPLKVFLSSIQEVFILTLCRFLAIILDKLSRKLFSNSLRAISVDKVFGEGK
jgi:hypothetical protein